MLDDSQECTQASSRHVRCHSDDGVAEPPPGAPIKRRGHTLVFRPRRVTTVLPLCSHDGLSNPAEQILNQRRENRRYQQAIAQNRLQSGV